MPSERLPKERRPIAILGIEIAQREHRQFVSVDGQRSALEAIQKGEMNATVECNPRFGPIAFETIEQLEETRRQTALGDLSPGTAPDDISELNNP